MEVAKIPKGFFLYDGATQAEKQVASERIASQVLGMRSTAGGNQPSAISSRTDQNGFNRLCVEHSNQIGALKSVQTAINMSAATQTILTVPAGHTYCLIQGVRMATASACSMWATLPDTTQLTIVPHSTLAWFTVWGGSLRLPAGTVITSGVGGGTDTAILINIAYYDEVNLPNQKS